MRLRPRLAFSHGIIIALMCLVFATALFAIHRMAEQVRALTSSDTRAIEATEHIREALGGEVMQLMREMLAPRDASSIASIDSDQAPIRAAIDDARTYFVAPEERAALNDFEQKNVHFENAVAIWRAGQMAQAGADQLPSDFNALRQSVVHLRQIKNQKLIEAAVSARDLDRSVVLLLAMLGLLALFAGMLATLRLVRTITRPVDQLSALVQRMSQGDFELVYKDGSIDEFNVLGRHFAAVGRALRVFRATNLERIVVEQRRGEAVLDSIGDGLVIFSEQGLIERINPVAERQLGIERGSAAGKRFEDVGDVKAGLRVREVLATGAFVDAGEPEIVIERDGEPRILEYWLNRFVESESGRAGAVMVMRDVTSQREFDKMRSEFVLRASHELRTPITSIRMGLSLLGEKMQFPAGSRDAELYQTVQQELNRMVGLLTDLLDLSRLRAGEQTMERAPVDIPELLTQARQRFEPASTQAGITVDVDLEEGLRWLPLSHTGFDRVLDNLIGNALRHTPQGGNITLGAHRAGERVAISVTDTGQGVPYAQQALIFQPFVQIGNRKGGAGLGLAICKEIVHQHGGEIRLASMPGRGTTFTILLQG
jgi:two-component system, NtrC family, sensor histidine kinase KinB